MFIWLKTYVLALPSGPHNSCTRRRSEATLVAECWLSRLMWMQERFASQQSLAVFLPGSVIRYLNGDGIDGALSLCPANYRARR